MVDYCISSLQKKRKDELAQMYFAECLRMLTANTAKLVQQGEYIDKKLFDIYEDIETPEKKEPTAEEIIERMKAKMNTDELI